MSRDCPTEELAGSVSPIRHCATRQIEAPPELRAGVRRVLRDDGRAGSPARLPLPRAAVSALGAGSDPAPCAYTFECPGGAGNELRCSWGRPHVSSPRPLSIALEASLRPRAAAHAEGPGVAWLPGLVNLCVLLVTPRRQWRHGVRGWAAQVQIVREERPRSRPGRGRDRSLSPPGKRREALSPREGTAPEVGPSVVRP